MTALLNVRDAVRDFFRRFDEVITPVFRFVVAYIMFVFINNMYGYEPLFSKSIVIVLLSIICALVSDKVVVFIAGVVILMNTLAVSKELALLLLVALIAMYCTYLRLFPDSAWIMIFVPILYKLNLTYAIPILVMMFVGMSGIIPIAFGGILYYFSVYTKEIKDVLAGSEEDKNFQAYKYVLDAFVDNKELIVQVIVFAVAIIIGFIFYRMSINYAWYIGIGVCAVVSIIFFAICGAMLSADIDFASVILGTLVGTVVSLIVQFFKSTVAYSRKETVQFEDDEYYYYVKAVPKYNYVEKKTNKDK